jgi:hypothetical protein
MTAANRRPDWRDVPLDTLRAWYSDLASLSSLRDVGERVGINHSTLHAFVSGAEPIPRTRRILAEWYMEQHGMDRVPYTALDALSMYFPVEARTGFRERFAELMAQQFRESGQPLPPWLAGMLDRE